MKHLNIKEAAAFLLDSDGYLIYTHANPDGDTLGSALALAMALRATGKKAWIFSVDGIPKKLDFLPTEGYFIDEPDNADDYVLVSVDVAGPKMLGSAKHNKFALAIDHHKVNTIECDNSFVLDDRIACGEIIYKIIDALGVNLTKDIAVAIYTAICSDSGGFKYDATKPETHIIAAKCIELGIDFAEINRRLFENKTKSQVELIKNAYRYLEFVNNGKYAFVAIPPEVVTECGAGENDFDCVNGIPREIEGVLASAVIRQKANGIKVSIRSNADIDVAEIAHQFGGGGHYHAAGFGLDCDFETAVKTVRKIFGELN